MPPSASRSVQLDELRLGHSDVRQLAVLLCVVDAIAHNELIGALHGRGMGMGRGRGTGHSVRSENHLGHGHGRAVGHNR